MSYINFSMRGTIGIVTFSNPEKLNALSLDALRETGEFLSQLRDSILAGKQQCTCLILTGEGKAFIGGANIREMLQMEPMEAKSFSRTGNMLMRSISAFPVPVIAAVNGFALGGGMETALSADFIYASEKAKLGFPEVTLGIIPGFGGIPSILRLIGPGAAKELVYTGRVIKAEEAKALGIVNKVFSSEELIQETVHCAEEISKASPFAVREAKAYFNQILSAQQLPEIEGEISRFGLGFSHPDRAAGMEAFLNKQKPEWR